MIYWLLVWNMAVIFPYIGNVIIPTDEPIFFRGVETTNQFKSFFFKVTIDWELQYESCPHLLRVDLDCSTKHPHGGWKVSEKKPFWRLGFLGCPTQPAQWCLGCLGSYPFLRSNLDSEISSFLVLSMLRKRGDGMILNGFYFYCIFFLWVLPFSTFSTSKQ